MSSLLQLPTREVKSADESLGEAKKDDSHRLFFGIAFGVLGLAMLGLVSYFSLKWMDGLELKGQPISDKQALYYLIFSVSKLLAHAAVSVVGIYAGYGLLKAAERMFVPRLLIREAGNAVEMARVILGIDTPVKEMVKTAGEIASAVKPLLSGSSKNR